MLTVQERFFLSSEVSILVVIDVQERLCSCMDEAALGVLTGNTMRLFDASAELGIPVTVTEQFVDGLGPTLPDLSDKMAAVPGFDDMNLRCCGCNELVERIQSLEGKQIVITGMEAHVCVLNTVLELLDLGYVVHVVKDAVLSRSDENREIALGIMSQAGAVITCTESVLFQWFKTSGADACEIMPKLMR